MRIGLVTADFGPGGGGIESIVAAQAVAHRRSGHDVRIVSGAAAPDDVAAVGVALPDGIAEGLAGIEVVRLPRLRAEGYDLELARPRLLALALAALAERDVVHVHHLYTLSDHLVRALARRRPVVLHLHDHFADCPRFFRAAPDGFGPCPPGEDARVCARCLASESRSRTTDLLERQLLARARSMRAEIRAAAAVLVPSRGHGRALAQALGLPAFQPRVHRPGLRAEIGLARPCPPLPGRGGELVLAHFGRRSPEKGSLDLVRALAALPAPARARVRLLAAGGSVSEDFDRLLEREAGDLRLELAGLYEAAALAALAARAHLAAFPSRLPESYSLVIDEALALGLPVWTSESAIVRERVSEPAVRFLPAREPAAWTRAVERLLEDPEPLRAARSVLPLRGRDAGAAAAELERLFEELLATPPARRALT